MLKYTQQNSSQTLKEGLQEYYDSNPQEVKDFAKKIPFLVDHDITHVIFGLGTSIEEESLLDTWTIRGTDISWRQIYNYAFDSELWKLTKIIVKNQGGWFKIIKVVTKCIPLKLLIHFNRIPNMKKKWPYSGIKEEILSIKLKELRKEYGIRLISYN
tara:strand:- start:80 stop:550 length:471 start_codon:yes stop_codon:yes gene_type:complete